MDFATLNTTMTPSLLSLQLFDEVESSLRSLLKAAGRMLFSDEASAPRPRRAETRRMAQTPGMAGLRPKLIATLGLADVQAVHNYLVLEFAATGDPMSPPGVRDENLLASAVSRQHVGFEDQLKYGTPCLSAATLMFGICNNHPFHNGNKRTALVAGLTHLDRNGLVLDTVTRKELYDLMLSIARHDMSGLTQRDIGSKIDFWDMEVWAIAAWLEDHVRRITRGERVITYGQLYRILEKFGYRMGDKRNNKVEVLRQKKRLLGGVKFDCVLKIPCPGDGLTVSLNEIKYIRERLGLRESDGTDSTSFYDTQAVIDSFVHQHRMVLRSLAKV
jgi:death on curing protein